MAIGNKYGTSLSLLFSALPCREREQPPRFAQPGTFEFEYSSRWKALDEMEKQQREQVRRNIQEAKEKLEAEMETAKHEHQLMMMRQGIAAVELWLSPFKLALQNNTQLCILMFVCFFLFFTPDLMRRQEELRRLEELRNQELHKRKQMAMRYMLAFLITNNCNFIIKLVIQTFIEVVI